MAVRLTTDFLICCRPRRDRASEVEQDFPKSGRRTEVLEVLAGEEDVFQEFPQAGDIPLALAYLKEEPAFRPPAEDFEGPVKGVVGGDNPEVAVQHDEGFSHSGDDPMVKLAQRPGCSGFWPHLTVVRHY
jgi:hypothetical protein